MGKLLRKLFGIGWIDEMQKGKPVVVVTATGLFAQKQMKTYIQKARELGYEVQNISQSGAFLDEANYTIIFRKVRGFQTQRARQLRGEA